FGRISVTGSSSEDKRNCKDYVREHQNDIRNEYLLGIYDAISRGDNDGFDCGSRLILPRSFTCGPPYMYSHYLDALSICRVHDKADIVDKVFEMKIHQFIAYLRDAKPFGKIVADWHTLLLHIHRTIPDVKRTFQRNSVLKRILTKLVSYITKRDTGVTTSRQNIDLDNGYVVPYNKNLLSIFYTHINVEYYGWTMLIKYLFKYISKGTDHVVARISKNSTDATGPSNGASTSRPRIVIDEIKNYLDARYISPHEACWRIFKFEIHYRESAVQILSVHLQNIQRVIFKERDHLDSIVVNAHRKKTTLTEWLHYNENNTDGRHLTYLNFPSEFVWYAGKYWRHRRRMTKSSIGRLTYVHPAARELFYLRLLLCYRTGWRIFPEICTINDVVYPTYRSVCDALGLLEDDQEWEITLQEAALTATPVELRMLLAHILTFCQVSDPVRLWKRMWKSMSEDILYTSSISLNIPNLHIDDSDLEDYVLYELEGC
ncbi:hypothetical protein Tco_1469572, partial [Tanacetum coccineum]